MGAEYKIVFLTFALLGLALGQYHQNQGQYPYFGQNHAMVVDHSAGAGGSVQLRGTPSRTLVRIPVYTEPPARPPSQLLTQQSHHRVPVQIEAPRETVHSGQHQPPRVVYVEPHHRRAPTQVQYYPRGHMSSYSQSIIAPYYGHNEPYSQGPVQPVQQQLSQSYSQQLPQQVDVQNHVPEPQVSVKHYAPEPQVNLQSHAAEPQVNLQSHAPEPQVNLQSHAPEPQVNLQSHAPEPQVYAHSHDVKEQQPIKKGPRYEVIMYEKREFVEPPKSHRGHGDKEKAQKYYSYGYGINYGQHAPGQEFEKGYGYVRAYGKAECKEPPCNGKFEFIGNREPYGFRN